MSKKIFLILLFCALFACSGSGGGGGSDVPSVSGGWVGNWTSEASSGPLSMQVSQDQITLSATATFTNSIFKGPVKLRGRIDSGGFFFLENPGYLDIRGKVKDQSASGSFVALRGFVGTWVARR